MTIPSFSLAFVSCVKDYLDHIGDTDFVAEMLPTIAKILQTFIPQLTEEGLLADFIEEAYWNFYEWNDGLDGWEYEDGKWQGHATPGRYAPLQAMYIMAAEQYLSMCEATNTAPFVENLSDIVARMRQAAQQFWNEERQQFVTCLDADKPYCELIQAQFICAGIATPKQAALLRKKMTAPAAYGLTPITQSHCIYKYEALLADPKNYGAFVRKNIADIWGEMLFKGATSFWETQRGAWDFDNAGSLCHGWATIPIYIYHRYADFVL